MAVIKCKGTRIVGPPEVWHIRVSCSRDGFWIANGGPNWSGWSEESPVSAIRNLMRGRDRHARLFMEVEQAFGYVHQEATWDGREVTLVEPVRIQE